MRHFTEFEFITLLENGESSFSHAKIQHFNTCVSCGEEYKKQLLAHNKLIKLKPMVLPAFFTQKVLTHLGQLNMSFKTQEKTDWFFILALTMLFFVAFWYTFAGNIDFFAADYLKGVKAYAPEINKPGIIVFLSNQLSKLANYGSKFSYLMIGLISILAYWILDKHLAKAVHIKKVKI